MGQSLGPDSSSAVRWSTASRRAFPGLKCGTRFSGIATLSPLRVHGLQNGLDGKFCVAVGELAEPGSEFFDKIGACHIKKILTKKRPVQDATGRF